MSALYGVDFNSLKKAQTWRELDELFTRKVYSSFKSSILYYNASSCLHSISSINVPTLVLHAKDDPITPINLVPVEELLKNPNIIKIAY